MLLRVFLRQHKGLFNFPVVEIREIDSAVVAVVATTGHHDPMAVARP